MRCQHVSRNWNPSSGSKWSDGSARCGRPSGTSRSAQTTGNLSIICAEQGPLLLALAGGLRFVQLPSELERFKDVFRSPLDTLTIVVEADHERSIRFRCQCIRLIEIRINPGQRRKVSSVRLVSPHGFRRAERLLSHRSGCSAFQEHECLHRVGPPSGHRAHRWPRQGPF